MTRGSMMNGPTPIISSMLKATAERRPMRRWRVAAEVAEAIIMRQFRSPDCTLTGSMIFAQRAIRIVTLAAFAGLAGAGTLRLAAQEATQQPTQQAVSQSAPQGHELALVPHDEASEIALPLPADRGAAG